MSTLAPAARRGSLARLPLAALFLAGLLLAGVPQAGPAAADAPDFALYGETLAWRLEPPDGGAPSYMVGTMHLIDDRLETAIGRALALLHEAGGLVVEVDMSAAGQDAVIAAMLLPEGRSLEDIIGADNFARLGVIADEYGIPIDYLDRLAPWGVAMTISLPLDQLQKMAAGAPYFDQRLMLEAAEAGLPVETLETVEEQIAALSGGSEAEQAEMLIRLIDTRADQADISEAMIELYVADDLAGLAGLLAREMTAGDELLDAALFDVLVDDRNRLMAERVAPLLAERSYLVAVGAMHLPGEEGVLNLLARSGWTVSPLRAE